MSSQMASFHQNSEAVSGLSGKKSWSSNWFCVTLQKIFTLLIKTWRISDRTFLRSHPPPRSIKSLRLFLSLYFSVSLFISLYFSVSLYISLSIYFNLSLAFSLTVSVSFHLSISTKASVFLSLSFCIFASLSSSIYLYAITASFFVLQSHFFSLLGKMQPLNAQKTWKII